MTSIVLFWAEWCPHCQHFKPTWEKIKVWCDKNDVSAKDFEDSKVQEMNANSSKNTTGIPLDMIDGYPTIIIKRGSGDFVKVGNRSEENIIKMLEDNISESPKNAVVQSGGSCVGGKCNLPKYSDGSNDAQNEFYKNKYIIYKNKYLELKKKSQL